MKKTLTGIIAAAVISTNAFAGWIEGTVKEIKQFVDNRTYVIITKADNTDVSAIISNRFSSEEKKQFLATILTAKATSATVRIHQANDGWSALIIK